MKRTGKSERVLFRERERERGGIESVRSFSNLLSSSGLTIGTILSEVDGTVMEIRVI